MTLAGRRRAVRKNVSEVAPAACTDFFYADHSVASVAHPPNVCLVIGLEEAWPTRTGVEFRTRPKERQTTEAARVDAILVVVEKHPTEGSLCAVLEQHVVFLRGKACNDRVTLVGTWWREVEFRHDREASPVLKDELQLTMRNSPIIAVVDSKIRVSARWRALPPLRCSVPQFDWSERRDLNSGPLAPHASALPGCATLRHDCSYLGKTRATGWGSAVRSNHDTPFSAGRGAQRRSTLISSSSSTRTCLTIC